MPPNPEQLGTGGPAGNRVPGDLEVGGTLNGVSVGDMPVEVTGDRNDPEEALANLLSALDALGIITDSTAEGT